MVMGVLEFGQFSGWSGENLPIERGRRIGTELALKPSH